MTDQVPRMRALIADLFGRTAKQRRSAAATGAKRAAARQDQALVREVAALIGAPVAT